MTDTNHAEVIRNFLLWARDDAGYAGPGDARVAADDVPKALAALDALTREAEDAKALSERLKLEAQMQAGEARAHIAIVQECYQIATGATGEPATWNGAEPIRKAFTAQAERIAKLEEALRIAKDAMAERRSYVNGGDYSGCWQEMKYGTIWDEEDAQVAAALAPKEQ